MILTIQIDRVLFGPNGTGWCILKTDMGICKGVVGWTPKPGDRLKVEGDWKRSDYNGAQEFAFKTAVADIPVDARGLLAYAASITKGIGAKAEDAIWDAYGDQWQSHPELDGVPGISHRARVEWLATMARLKDIDAHIQAVAWLIGKGVTLNMAAKAWDLWQGATLGTVQANPYALCDLPNYGFAHVDKLRAAFGIEAESPNRFDAAVLYCMGQLAAQGDTAFRVGEVFIKCEQVAGMNDVQMAMSTARLSEANRIAVVETNVEIWLVRRQDYDNEAKVWGRFKA